MEPLPQNDQLHDEANSPFILFLLFFSIFVIMIIYQFLYNLLYQRSIFDLTGLSLVSRGNLLLLISSLGPLFIFSVLFVIVRAVPGRNTVVRGTFLLAVLFFVVAYMGNLVGLTIFYLIPAQYLIGPNVISGFSVGITYFLIPVSFSVTIAFVCIGAVFSRRTVRPRLTTGAKE